MVTEPQLDTVEMMLNMGPQHPATHGVFRMVLTIDGERIVDMEPHIGYLHRGSEKLCEGEQYSQIITLFDRMDYLSNFNNELVLCAAVEKLMDIEVPQPHYKPLALLRYLRPGRRRHDAGDVRVHGAGEHPEPV